MKRILYCGTYGNGGIYRISFEDGKLAEPSLFCPLDSPKYLAKGEGFFAALCRQGERSGAAIIDENGQLVTSLMVEDVTPCYLGVADNRILLANYHEGTFHVLRYQEQQLHLEKRIDIAKKAGCHQLLAYGNLLVGFALFKDCIYLYDADYKCIREIHFPKGTGPRHGVFSKDGNYLYAVSELSNEVFLIRTADWQILDHVRLSEGKKAASAAIRLTEDRLTVSVRGINRIYIVAITGEKLQVINDYDCGGDNPRDLIVVDGYVVVANRYSNRLCCLDEKGVISEVAVPEAVSVIAD